MKALDLWSALLMTALISVSARALELESYTEAGKTTSSEDLTLSGGQKNSEGMKTDWNVEGSRTKSTSTASTGANIADTTTEINGGMGLTSPTLWTGGLALDYASTPDEKLTDFGPSVYVGYTHEFRKRDGFTPNLAGKLTASTLNYVQKLSGISRVSGRERRGGENSIRQNALAAEVSSKVRSWVKLKVSETFYGYSKDPSSYLALLDSNRVIQARTAGMSSTVTGFPSHETLLKGYFYTGDNWTEEVSEIVDKSVIDGSLALTFKLLVSYDFTDAFTAGLGFQNEQSDLVKENLALLDLDYQF